MNTQTTQTTQTTQSQQSQQSQPIFVQTQEIQTQTEQREKEYDREYEIEREREREKLQQSQSRRMSHAVSHEIKNTLLFKYFESYCVFILFERWDNGGTSTSATTLKIDKIMTRHQCDYDDVSAIHLSTPRIFTKGAKSDDDGLTRCESNQLRKSRDSRECTSSVSTPRKMVHVLAHSASDNSHEHSSSSSTINAGDTLTASSVVCIVSP